MKNKRAIISVIPLAVALSLLLVSAKKNQATSNLVAALQTTNTPAALEALASGARIDNESPTEFDDHPFVIAIHHKMHLVVDHLIAQGANLQIRSFYGETLLHAAVLVKSPEFIPLLVTNGVPINATNINGATALSLAATFNELPAARELLRLGADVNLPNGRGETPLWLASSKGHHAMAQLLLQKGANPSLKDLKGRRPGEVVRLEPRK